MQTYQSLWMYRQHHKTRKRTKTPHPHQLGVNALQERSGTELRERGSSGNQENGTGLSRSICPNSRSTQMDEEEQGWGSRCGVDAAAEGAGVRAAWAARVQRGRQQRRLNWAPGERGIFSIFSSEAQIQQPGRYSDRRQNCRFIWADITSSCSHWKASTR